jgi:hypothetical protein
MATCAQCGNEYDKTFQVTRGSESFDFDSFECAIAKMAPTCEHCKIKIIGHGIEAGGRTFCCAHCAEHAGVSGAVDRVS